MTKPVVKKKKPRHPDNLLYANVYRDGSGKVWISGVWETRQDSRDMRYDNTGGDAEFLGALEIRIKHPARGKDQTTARLTRG